MKVNFCISGIPATGGIRAIFEYANGLRRKGHTVTITIPYRDTKPTWFDLEAALIMPSESDQAKTDDRQYSQLHEMPEELKTYAQYIQRRTNTEQNLLLLMPDCDINIATDFPTAIPVYLSKKGKGCYFMQHYERLFADARPFDSLIEALDADYTYHLPLVKIANSSWLKNIIWEKFEAESYLCCNGVNLDHFHPLANTKDDNRLTIASFSGNGVAWKGFKDAVAAMKIVFDQTRDKNIVWKVYGGAPEVTTEDAGIPFEYVGQVYKEKLTELYNEADIVFLSSWYESFPLPPLEAMACGTPVVVTEYGTEDYAIDGETALVVTPRQPEELAKAILTLIDNPKKRDYIARNGIDCVRKFSWQNAVINMENILGEIAAGARPPIYQNG
ncbi:MAG: glycosyltransferase family 4 protein [Actinomycetota bacterium]|nr:glycosyltransferase family 4 protein [Actinomycetota bacterium]